MTPGLHAKVQASRQAGSARLVGRPEGVVEDCRKTGEGGLWPAGRERGVGGKELWVWGKVAQAYTHECACAMVYMRTSVRECICSLAKVLRVWL